jgi:hypothetical protein
MSNNNVVVSQSTSIIQSGAFSELFAQAISQLGGAQTIDLEINIGEGNIVIEEAAFRQVLTNANINSASITFNSQSVPTIGANFASGLPLRTLTLPTQTTVQADALQGLDKLNRLDVSQLVNPLVPNALNLARTSVEPLIIEMPSSPSATFSTGSVVIPQTAANATTTLVFSGHVPPTSQLNGMFQFQSSTTPAPLQVSLDFANTSNISDSTIQALRTSLTNVNGEQVVEPLSVSYNQVQAVFQGQAQNLQAGGPLADISQFVGDFFDYAIIAPSAQNAKTVNQCVVTSLSATAKAVNVQNIPIPSAITPATGVASDVKHNVIGLVSSMNISGTQFYIVDNYMDPTNVALPSVPLVAIFSKGNANAGVGNFFPALVCNGTVAVVNGAVTVSGARGAATNYCRGYNQASNPAVVDLLAGVVVGSSVPLYDRSQSANILPIATISYPDATSFSVVFQPTTTNLNISSEPILGCMQNYIPGGVLRLPIVADFTNLANAANASWLTFSTRVSTLIANNNALVNILTQIRAQGQQTGVNMPTIPGLVSISEELTALSKSDFIAALASWNALESKYTNNYAAYLTAMQNYATGAITATQNNTTAGVASAHNAFIQLHLNLTSPTSPLAAVRADFGLVQVNNDNVASLYAGAVSGYINARFSLGSQTFKNCTTLQSVINFEFLRNISKINDQSFYFCSAFKGPIIIPSNVVSIGANAFNACTNVKGIDIQDATALRTIGDSAFENCNAAEGNLAFSSAIRSSEPSVERIGTRAFFGCAQLTGHLYFPHGLQSLGVSAFEGCSNLNGTIVFPTNANFTAIPDSAFANCSSLTGISTNTGNGTSLVYANLPAAYANNASKPIPNGLILPANITQIGANAFRNCNFAGALNLQQTTTSAIASIGNSAFRGCSAFTSLVLPSTSTYTAIAFECFMGCTGITSLTLPNNIVQISDSAFEDCIRIANVPKLDNVNFIGNSAFKSCIAMAGALVLGTNLNTLGTNAFEDCVLLSSATFLGPPPSTLKSTSLIFGVTAPASTPFHVNVFTENGWNGTNIASAIASININNVFRSKQGANSRVQMAFIDFNTVVPPSTPRELTINNYQSFNVYENDADANGGTIDSPDADKLWNDVYIPSTLLGENLAAAQSNINQAPLLQSQLTALVTPRIDAVKSSAIDLSFRANAVLNTIDARNVVVRQGLMGAIPLFSMLTAADLSTTSEWHGVLTVDNVDYLRYAITNATPTVLLNHSNVSIGARSFFVNADSNAAADFRTKYNHKVINVDNNGAISISSNVKAIGYGAVNEPTTVQYTSSQPKTDRNENGYSIVKSTVAGQLDKLYLDALIAAAGTYFVSSVATTGTVTSQEASKYNGKMIEVKEDGSVHIVESQTTNSFITVSAANAAANAGAITAVGQYGIIAGAQSGANTAYQLFRKTSAEAAAAHAPAGHYHIQSSDIPQLNNAIVLVLPNGGISVESAGVSGAVSRLEERIALLAAEQIPIYSTNANFQNTNHHINNVFAHAHSQYYFSNQLFEEGVLNHNNEHASLNSQLDLVSNLRGAIVGQLGITGTAFNSVYDTLQVSTNGLNGLDALNGLYNVARTNYENAVIDLKDMFASLQQIQSDTLANPLNGINVFRRKAIFSANALSTALSVAEDPLSNDLGYITTQIESFMTQILKRQYSNKFNNLADLIGSVKTNVSFPVSPTTDAVSKSLLYTNFSQQQKILFDYTENLIGLWYKSDTVGPAGVAGGQNTWGTPATTVAGTKLYYVTGTDAVLESALLQWGKDNIFAYFFTAGATVYQQFLTKVNDIASFANIRASVSAYEAAHAAALQQPNATNESAIAAAIASARSAYINAVKRDVLTIGLANAVNFDNTTTAPTDLANGQLRFNQADQTQATQLYISLMDNTNVTPAAISFAGYADTIKLNNSITFTIKSVTKTANSYILDVTHVAGTGAADSISTANPVTFVTYQTASDYTLATLDAMNNFVHQQYHQQGHNFQDGVTTIVGIKLALTQANTNLKNAQIALVSRLNELNSRVNTVVQNANALNVAENTLMSNLQSIDASGTALVLNGANMLHRELDLLQKALSNTEATVTVNNLPLYESKWFNDRVAAFSNNSRSPADARVLYNTAHTQFVTARFARQTAAIKNYVANAPPSQNISSPVSTEFINEQSQKIAQAIPIFVSVENNNTKEEVAKIIASVVSTYVLGRNLATANLTADALNAAISKYQEFKKKEAADELSAANVAYGNASYQRYIALIDLAISVGYHGGNIGLDTLTNGATNAFQTLMKQWHAASNTSRPQIFDLIKPLLFNMVYRTDETSTYVASNTTFPLRNQLEEIISWFGASQNGFLSKVIADGLIFANQVLNQNNGGLSFASYELAQRTVKITINSVTSDYTVDNNNSVTIDNISVRLINPTTTPSGPSSQVITLPTFKLGVISATADATNNNANNNAVILNAFNVTAARNAADAISSVKYDVTSIGYSSLPLPSPANLPLSQLGFFNSSLNFGAALVTGKVRYRFQFNTVWYHGYQQSSTLVNSWKKLSPAQDVVIFYPGTADQLPANLDAAGDSITALCDDAKFVMIIEPVAGSTTVQSVSIYHYDVWGVNSGALLAVGTLTLVTNQPPTVALYTVNGAFQKVNDNPAGTGGVHMVGDLVISNKVKTIGIRAFSGLNRIRTLTIQDGGAVNIGSNAFESCSLLSAINLSSSVKSIGSSAFMKCTGAASLALPPAVPQSSFSMNHWAFLGCNNIANDVKFPNNLSQINVQVFAGCTKLQCSQLNEKLPVSVQKIGLGAFFNCKGLAGSLNFNNSNQNGKFVSSVGYIGSAAFMGCSGLFGDLVLPDNVAYLNVLPYTFASMDAPVLSIAAVQLQQPFVPTDAVPMALTGAIDFALNKVTAVERSAFYRCNKLSVVNLSNVISFVGIQSFLGCSGLNQILSVPASVKIIGAEAFKGCSGLTGLIIASTTVSQTTPEGLSLGKSCFQDCTSIATSGTANGIVIPNSVSSIGDEAFKGCTSIENVSIGSGLTLANSFGSLVFSGCTKLARVTLAFSFLSRNIAGQSVVKNAVLPVPNPTGITYNASFTGCTVLGVPSDAPIGTIQIQSGAVGWTPGRAAFFNNLTIVVNNKNITFYLKEFNKLANINVVDPSTEPLQQEAIPPTDAQATVYIKASDMRKVFLTSTDSFVGQGANGVAVDQGQMFFVRPEYFPQYLNVANAQVVQGGIESYNAAIYEQLVKDDVMRYYAMSLFKSADWVTLFANDTEMLENMVASSGLMPIVPDGNYDDNDSKHLYNTGVLYNIMTELNKVAHIKTSAVVDPNDRRVQSTNYPSTGTPWWGLPDTVLPEQGNIGKKLFSMINRNDPNRISSMINGSTPSELPFLPGDQFIFIFTLNENSVALTPGLPPVVVKKRTYLIRMILTDDFVSGDASFMGHFNALYTPSPRNLNVLPVSGAYAADYMYSNYNLQLAIKPSVLNQTANSVYSRVTQNTFEPIPMPVNLLPFTGWYYSYPYNSQTIRLNFTPPDLSVTNRFVFNDLRYLSAYVYYPENWGSVSVLPNPNNFPQWVLTFDLGDGDVRIIKYKAGFLNPGAETVNFLGQTVPFDYTNTHVHLVCPLNDLIAPLQLVLGGTAGTDANGEVIRGTVNTIAGTNIYRQRSGSDYVSGLRKTSSKVGPFTYPPVARGYQGINMQAPTDAQTTALITNLRSENTTASLKSIHLEINMANNDGFVPSVIVKSVEVVAKNYEAYYLAPLDPN